MSSDLDPADHLLLLFASMIAFFGSYFMRSWYACSFGFSVSELFLPLKLVLLALFDRFIIMVSAFSELCVFSGFGVSPPGRRLLLSDARSLSPRFISPVSKLECLGSRRLARDGSALDNGGGGGRETDLCLPSTVLDSACAVSGRSLADDDGALDGVFQ